jgi:hypothetical protein
MINKKGEYYFHTENVTQAAYEQEDMVVRNTTSLEHIRTFLFQPSCFVILPFLSEQRYMLPRQRVAWNEEKRRQVCSVSVCTSVMGSRADGW